MTLYDLPRAVYFPPTKGAIGDLLQAVTIDARAEISADRLFAPKLQRQLARLDDANGPNDMNVPGWNLHNLSVSLAGHYTVQVNGNWRMTFAFDDGDAVLVDYQDYH